MTKIKKSKLNISILISALLFFSCLFIEIISGKIGHRIRLGDKAFIFISLLANLIIWKLVVLL